MGISSTHGTLPLLLLRKGYCLILFKDFYFTRVRPHTLCVCDHPQSPDRGLLIITLIPNRQSPTYSSDVWRVLGISIMPTANLEKNKISVQTCCSCVWWVLGIPMMPTASLENYKISVQMYSSCVWSVLGIPLLPTASLEKNTHNVALVPEYQNFAKEEKNPWYICNTKFFSHLLDCILQHIHCCGLQNGSGCWFCQCLHSWFRMWFIKFLSMTDAFKVMGKKKKLSNLPHPSGIFFSGLKMRWSRWDSWHTKKMWDWGFMPLLFSSSSEGNPSMRWRTSLSFQHGFSSSCKPSSWSQLSLVLIMILVLVSLLPLLLSGFFSTLASLSG